MMRFLVFLAGALLGTALTGAALWLNPLIGEPRHAPVLEHGVSAEFHTSLRAEDLPLLTHSGSRRLVMRPESVPELWESVIDPLDTGLLMLRDVEGRVVGTASRISAISGETDPLRRGLLVDSSWIISLEGVGLAFAVQRENVWPMLRDVALPAWARREPWRGDLRFTPAAGPREDRAGRLIGVSGALAGLEGQLVGNYRLRAFDPDIGPTALEWHGVMSLPRPDAVEAEAASAAR